MNFSATIVEVGLLFQIKIIIINYFLRKIKMKCEFNEDGLMRSGGAKKALL